MQENVKNNLVSSVKTCNLGALRHLKQLNNFHGIIKIALNPPSTVLSLCLVYPSSSAYILNPFANLYFIAFAMIALFSLNSFVYVFQFS